MKKFAYFLMGSQFDTEKDQATFETPGMSSSIFTVRNFEEAKQKALWCQANGYGVIELCGAFGKERAEELIQLTDGQVGIAYVVNTGKQATLFSSFFGG